MEQGKEQARTVQAEAEGIEEGEVGEAREEERTDGKGEAERKVGMNRGGGSRGHRGTRLAGKEEAGKVRTRARCEDRTGEEGRPDDLLVEEANAEGLGWHCIA
eukprot:750757-Hanusia_phi.AAC.2